VGKFVKGDDAKESAVDGTMAKLLWCPLMSGQLIPKNCDGAKCMLWRSVVGAGNRVQSGCIFVVAGVAQIELVELLNARMGGH